MTHAQDTLIWLLAEQTWLRQRAEHQLKELNHTPPWASRLEKRLSKQIGSLMVLVSVEQDTLTQFGADFETAIGVVAAEIADLVAKGTLPAADVTSLQTALTDLQALEPVVVVPPVVAPVAVDPAAPPVAAGSLDPATLVVTVAANAEGDTTTAAVIDPAAVTVAAGSLDPAAWVTPVVPPVV